MRKREWDAANARERRREVSESSGECFQDACPPESSPRLSCEKQGSREIVPLTLRDEEESPEEEDICVFEFVYAFDEDGSPLCSISNCSV